MTTGSQSIIGRIIASIIPPTNANVSGRVVSIAQALVDSGQSQRVEGEVVQQNPDGSVRINTPKGPIDILVQGRVQPQPGQQVQIDIPAGNPPRQVTIRNAPAPASTPNLPNTPSAPVPAPVQNTPLNSQPPTPPPSTVPQGQIRPAPSPVVNASPPAQTILQPQLQNPLPAGKPNTQIPTTALPYTPLAAGQKQGLQNDPLQTLQNIIPPATESDDIIKQNVASLPSPRISTSSLPADLLAKVQPNISGITNSSGTLIQNIPPPLQEGAVVRLLPLPPAQAQQVIQQTLQVLDTPELLQPSTLTKFDFTLSIIAQQADNDIQTLTLQIGKVAVDVIANALKETKTFIPLPLYPSSPQGNIIQTPQTPLQTAIQILAQPVLTTAPPEAQQISQPITAQQITTAIPTSPLTPILDDEFVFLPQSLTIPKQGPTPATISSPLATFIDSDIANIIPTPVTVSALGEKPSLPVLNTSPVLEGKPIAIPAQVIGFTPQNLPVITLHLPNQPYPQTFVLQTPASNLVPGTQIQIIPHTPSTPAITPGSPQTAQPLSLFDALRPGPWPVFNQILESISQVYPQAAQTIPNITPNPSTNITQMGPAALLFLAAVRSGDLTSWLGGGRSIDALQRTGKSGLLDRLSQENSINRNGGEPVAGDWRAHSIPLAWDNQIHRIALFTRQEHDKDSNDQDNKGQTRFILDLDLTRMGPVQIDGLVRGKRLDLILRTEHPFSEPMRQEIRQAYARGLDAVQYSGEISFQGDPAKWVHVLKQQETLGMDA